MKTPQIALGKVLNNVVRFDVSNVSMKDLFEITKAYREFGFYCWVAGGEGVYSLCVYDLSRCLIEKD